MITKIHGKYYDLSGFKHPGGPIQIMLAANRDATALFESHHLFSDKGKIKQILNKYEIKDPERLKNIDTAIFDNDVYDWHETWKDPFVIELMERVHAVLSRSEIKIDFKKIVELIIMFGLLFVSIELYILGYWISLLLFPTTLWLTTANLFHDASHFSLSNNWIINCIGTYIFPMFSSPSMWYHQHVIGHHNYPNVLKRDPDLYHGTALSRHTVTLRWRPLHKIQQYTTPLIWTCSIQMFISRSIRFYFADGIYKYNNSVSMMRFTANRLKLHLTGRIVNKCIMHVIPFLLMDSWIKGLIWSIIPMMLYSVCFMMASQVNHLVGSTANDLNTNFFRHQIITANNVATQSYLTYLFTGGLNLQIEHHLFPSVNHTHLYKIVPIVKSLCKKYSIQYNESTSIWSALYSHYKHLTFLSKENIKD